AGSTSQLIERQPQPTPILTNFWSKGFHGRVSLHRVWLIGQRKTPTHVMLATPWQPAVRCFRHHPRLTLRLRLSLIANRKSKSKKFIVHRRNKSDAASECLSGGKQVS